MPEIEFDIRAVFTRLCADAKAGEAGGQTYEAALTRAVLRLTRRAGAFKNARRVAGTRFSNKP